ncbi:MAG TPA: 3-ketoacyl-ACP reductase [Candidatus Sulfotelmatobacter sp.]|nr:3-ketoacyl-ACP reductase [Candidatus Sulfotelmatobacter sp.]
MSIPTRNRPAALITGGRRGIGRGIAWALAGAGFDVVLCDLVEDGAVKETLDGIEMRKRRSLFVAADIGALDTHEALIERAWQAFGGLDCLVNNAGVTSDVRGDLLELTPKSYDRVMAINLRGPFFLTQCFARRLIAAPPEGFARTIINISSASAVLPSIERGDYSVSKAGVSMMTRLFAFRLAQHGITVHEIRPGIVRTDMTAPVRERTEARIAAGGVAPINRWGEPADIGRAVAALATGAFAFSTGDAYHVDGGLHIGGR